MSVWVEIGAAIVADRVNPLHQNMRISSYREEQDQFKSPQGAIKTMAAHKISLAPDKRVMFDARMVKSPFETVMARY